MDLENLIPDDAFDTGFESTIVPAGHYKVKCIKGAPRVKTSRAGNRYLTVRLAATETKEGDRVNSEIIYHTIPIEGTDKNGKSLVGMFAGFFSAFGLEKDDVRGILASLLESAPAAGETTNAEGNEGVDVQLNLNGDHFSLDNRTLMASVKVEEYQGKEKNTISSVWADTAE